MDRFLSSLSGNMHIVRRLVSGFIVFAFIALAVAQYLGVVRSESIWENINANNSLVAFVFILSAYLIGSLTEYVGNNIIVYVASIFADAFAFPIRNFGWLPQPFRAISIAFGWVLAGFITIPVLIVQRVFGGAAYRHEIEAHLDPPGRALLRRLSPAVRYGLTHPISLHFDHAIEDVLSQCGTQREAMERLLSRQSDVSAVIASVLVGGAAYLLVVASLATGLGASEKPFEANINPERMQMESSKPDEFGRGTPAPLTAQSAPDAPTANDDVIVEKPQVLEEPIIEPSEYVDVDAGTVETVLILSILPFFMFFSLVFLGFLKSGVVSVVQVAASAQTQERRQESSGIFFMYGRRNPSKATRFVAQVFWLSLILTLPFEYLSWNFGDVAKHVDSYDLTYIALPDMLRTWAPEYVARFWINKLIWSLLLAINVFAYLSVFEVPYVAPVSPSRMPYVWAAGAFLLGYLSINYLVSGLILLLPEDEPRWARSALYALKHSLGFSLGGLLLWCSLRQGVIAQGFGRALQEHRGRLIAVTLVMFGWLLDVSCGFQYVFLPLPPHKLGLAGVFQPTSCQRK